MLFHSAQFLIFFPLATLIYFLIPRKGRGLWLLAVSYFFYLCWDPRYGLLLALVTLLTYGTGLLIQRSGTKKGKKLWLTVSFAACLAVLGCFKYAVFILESLAALFSLAGVTLTWPQFSILLPLGISFYLFQVLGYLVDVYRGKVEAEQNLLRYALFVAFFPKLVSGPIERAENLLPQMRDGQGEWGLGASFDFDRMRRGLLLMVWGLFLKLVIADRAALLVDTVFPKYWEYNGLQLAVAAVCFSIQLYCDFGGYSAVAIGAAQVLGFRLQDNFHQPYLALSIRDFWRRWHISLSGWFRDYLYIPLGGNRKGRARTYFNTMVTMLLSGLWHGAGWNYVVWGGLHGVYQVAGDVLRPARDRAVERLHIRREALVWKVLRGLITFGLVTLAWIFFRAESTRAALGLISGIISRFTLSLDGITGLGLDWKDLLVLLIAVLVLLAADLLGQNMQVRDRILALPLPARWAVYYLAVFSIFIFGIYGGNYDPSQFIYGQQF